MDIDVRARTQSQALALQEAIARIAQERDNERVRVELTGGLTRPAFPSGHNRTLAALAKNLAEQLSIQLHEVPPVGGGSDGNFTAGLGIPTLDGLGPVCNDICSRQETIEISSLVERGTTRRLRT